MIYLSLCELSQMSEVAVAPIGRIEGVAHVTSLVFLQEPRVNSCHSRYTSGVQLKRRKS